MVNARILRHDEPLAIELTSILKRGDIGGLSELLAADPGLAGSIVEDAKGGGRSPLHLFESAGYLLIRGADRNWPAPWSGQTPLDIAERSGRNDMAAWLILNNAVRGVRS